MHRVLIVAIGNPLRSDDGLAWHAADRLQNTSLSADVAILKAHQLTPELAELISQVALTIFVDASTKGNPGALHCEEIKSSAANAFMHHITPSGILGIAVTLYGKKPRAMLVSLTGKSFDHGESLSQEVAENVPRLIFKIRELMTESSSC